MFFKKFLRLHLMQSFLSWIISLYIKICYHSSIWLVKDNHRVEKIVSKKKRIIICFWHGNLLMTPLCWNFNKQFYMLISSHPDGRLISKAVSYFQIKTISGSSSKNKLSSTKKILKLINENKVIGITPDGPRGPRMVVKKGISSLAKSTNAVILPLSVGAKFKKNIKSWDRFAFVFPFNKFGIVWGNPIFWDDNKTFDSHSKEIENELKRITKLSETFVN